MKTLERMERIAAAHVDSPFEFAFPRAPAARGRCCALEHATLGYGERRAGAREPRVELLPGERIGLLGRNGAGKSTLMKTIGRRRCRRWAASAHWAQDLAIGYFAQHQVELLRADESPLWHLRQDRADGARAGTAQLPRRLRLPRRHGRARPVGRFSGGEKARLALALIVWQKPNLLLLDEPTNHLDLEMREALAVALQDFEGTLVLVVARPPPAARHHRRILARRRRQPGAVRRRPRRLPRLVLARARRGEATAAADAGGADGASPEGSAGDRKAKKREEAAARQQLYARRKPLTERLAKVERELAALTADKVAQDEWLASPAAYADDQRELLKERVAAQAELTWRLARLETEWLELSEAIEKLGEA